MSKIFISYRRDDSSTVAGRIYDRLVASFGRDTVFKDVDSIPLGVNFAEYIATIVNQCAVELVIIGPRWADERNRARLADPGDYVRLEIEAALRRNIPVIPILTQGATMPTADDVPESLQGLLLRNGLPVRDDPDFDHDIRRVVAALQRYAPHAPQTVPASAGYVPQTGAAPAPPRKTPASPRRVAITALAVVALSAVVFAGAFYTLLRSGIGASNSIMKSDLYTVTFSPSGTEGWAGGNGQILHYSDGKWSRTADRDISSGDGVWGVALVPGTKYAYAVGPGFSMEYYDGSNWSAVPGSSTWGQSTAITLVLNSAGSVTGWASNDADSGYGMLKYSNGAWTPDTGPETTAVKIGLLNMSLLPTGDAWGQQTELCTPIRLAIPGKSCLSRQT